MRQAINARRQQVRFLIKLELLPLSVGDRVPEDDLRQRGGTRNCHVCRRALQCHFVSALRCQHLIYSECFEDVLRNCRFRLEPGSPAAVCCPFCSERTDVCSTDDFFNVACRLLPRIARRTGARSAGGPIETLTEYASRVRNGGSAVLAALAADVDRLALPQFALGPRWGRVVLFYRQRAIDFSLLRSERVSRRGQDILRTCPGAQTFARCSDPAEGISGWATAVDDAPAGSTILPFPWMDIQPEAGASEPGHGGGRLLEPAAEAGPRVENGTEIAAGESSCGQGTKGARKEHEARDARKARRSSHRTASSGPVATAHR